MTAGGAANRCAFRAWAGAAEEPGDQRAQPGGIFRAGQPGRDLHIEQLGGRAADGQQAEFDLPASSVDDRLVARRGNASQKGVTSPTVKGSITAKSPSAATWIRQSTGRKVCSETNSVSKAIVLTWVSFRQ